MAASPPKFRTDLRISRQDTDRGTFFIVKNPGSSDFFRLRETEQFIAHQFDGKTPLEVIRKRTEEKFEAALSPEVLNAFIRNLEKSGLLESEDERYKNSTKKKRLAGNILYLRYKFLDPSRLFEYLIRVVGFCFTPWFVAFSALTILMAAATLTGGWDDYKHDLHGLFRVSAVPALIALAFTVICIHEFAHGLTCKHFGGEVHEIGFLLVYFQPALYCNVSDAWLFPEKSKRLWVGFAGPYFELFVWALAVLAWRLTDVETWINDAALMVMTTSGVKTLLNFNPFIKLDGYYLLSDYLEIPNLRRKSFRYIGCFIERLFGGSPAQSAGLTRRERRIFVTYGSIATVSSFLLICYVLLKAGTLLIENGKPAAFLATMAFLCLKLRRRFRRLFGKASDRSDPTDDGDDLSTSSRAESRTAAGPKKTRKVQWKRAIAWSVLAGGAAGLGYLAFSGRVELKVAGPFNVLPIDNSDARASVEGIIERIYVDEGDKVKAGQLIARLSDKDLRAELEKTEAEIRASGAKLRMLQAGPTTFQVDVAKAAVAKADDRLQYARNRELRIKGLFDEHLRSRNEYEDSKESARAAENDLAEAKSRLELLLSGNRPEEIEATKAQLDRLETERRYLREQLRLLNVLSPSTGIVATPSRQLKEMRHMLVRKGDLILKVYDFKTVTAQILVPEKDIDGVRVGQSVVLRARAYPGEEFHGKVTSIAISAAGSTETALASTAILPTTSSNSTGSNKTILVTSEIENRETLLKSEMTGFAKISCGQKRIIDLIKRRVARTVKVEFWSLW